MRFDRVRVPVASFADVVSGERNLHGDVVGLARHVAQLQFGVREKNALPGAGRVFDTFVDFCKNRTLG